MIRTYEGATGLKTGSTSLALYNLSASATRGNLSLIAVVLRAPTPNERVSNARNLLDYGFSNFEYLETSTKDKAVQKVKVEKGIEKELELVYKENSGIVLKRGLAGNIETKVNVKTNIEAPVRKGEKLGKVEFYLEEKKIASTDLIANASIDKKGVFTNFKYIMHQWFCLFR